MNHAVCARVLSDQNIERLLEVYRDIMDRPDPPRGTSEDTEPKLRRAMEEATSELS